MGRLSRLFGLESGEISNPQLKEYMEKYKTENKMLFQRVSKGCHDYYNSNLTASETGWQVGDDMENLGLAYKHKPIGEIMMRLGEFEKTHEHMRLSMLKEAVDTCFNPIIRVAEEDSEQVKKRAAQMDKTRSAATDLEKTVMKLRTKGETAKADESEAQLQEARAQASNAEQSLLDLVMSIDEYSRDDIIIWFGNNVKAMKIYHENALRKIEEIQKEFMGEAVAAAEKRKAERPKREQPAKEEKKPPKTEGDKTAIPAALLEAKRMAGEKKRSLIPIAQSDESGGDSNITVMRSDPTAASGVATPDNCVIVSPIASPSGAVGTRESLTPPPPPRGRKSRGPSALGAVSEDSGDDSPRKQPPEIAPPMAFWAKRKESHDEAPPPPPPVANSTPQPPDSAAAKASPPLAFWQKRAADPVEEAPPPPPPPTSGGGAAAVQPPQPFWMKRPTQDEAAPPPPPKVNASPPPPPPKQESAPPPPPPKASSAAPPPPLRSNDAPPPPPPKSSDTPPPPPPKQTQSAAPPPPPVNSTSAAPPAADPSTMSLKDRMKMFQGQ